MRYWKYGLKFNANVKTFLILKHNKILQLKFPKLKHSFENYSLVRLINIKSVAWENFFGNDNSGNSSHSHLDDSNQLLVG